MVQRLYPGQTMVGLNEKTASRFSRLRVRPVVRTERSRTILVVIEKREIYVTLKQLFFHVKIKIAIPLQ